MTLEDVNRYFAGSLCEQTWSSFPVEQRGMAVKDSQAVFQKITFDRTLPADRLINAVAEQAYCLLTNPSHIEMQMERVGIKSISTGKHSETYQDNKDASLWGLCPNAYGWISAYIAASRGIKTGRVVCP